MASEKSLWSRMLLRIRAGSVVSLPLRALKVIYVRAVIRAFSSIAAVCGPATVGVGRYSLELMPGDGGKSAELRINGVKEPLCMDLIGREAAGSRTIVDVGANIGYNVLVFAEKAPRSRIIAIEPVPETFRALNENIRRNKLGNVSAFDVGIANVNGQLPLYVSKKRNWSRFLMTEEGSGDIIDVIPSKVVTLDTLASDEGLAGIDFVRMDVEGFEVEVIEGMKGILKGRQRLKILMEMHWHLRARGDLDSMLMTLEENGFRIREALVEDDWRMHFFVKHPLLKQPLDWFRERLGDRNYTGPVETDYHALYSRTGILPSHILFEKAPRLR